MSSWLRISRDFCGLSAEPIPKDGHTPSIEPLGDTDAHQHVKRRAATDLESCGDRREWATGEPLGGGGCQ
jgi:hypothetical protein